MSDDSKNQSAHSYGGGADEEASFSAPLSIEPLAVFGKEVYQPTPILLLPSSHPPSQSENTADGGSGVDESRQSGNMGPSAPATRKRARKTASEVPKYVCCTSGSKNLLDLNLIPILQPRLSNQEYYDTQWILGHNLRTLASISAKSAYHYCASDYMAIYCDAVQCGLRLPLHPFISSFFTHYHIAPCQLVPSRHLLLVAYVLICKSIGILPYLNFFHYLFLTTPASQSVSTGFVSIQHRRGMKTIEGLPGNNLGWKHRFFFFDLRG